MLNDSNLPKKFWAEVVAIPCYILNRVLIRPLTKNTLTNYFIIKSLKYRTLEFSVVNVLY